MKLSDSKHLLPEENVRTYYIYDTIKAYDMVYTRYMDGQNKNDGDCYYGISLGKITLFIIDAKMNCRRVYIWYDLKDKSDALKDIIVEDKKLSPTDRESLILEYLEKYTCVLDIDRGKDEEKPIRDAKSWSICYVKRDEDNRNYTVMPEWKCV